MCDDYLKSDQSSAEILRLLKLMEKHMRTAARQAKVPVGGAIKATADARRRS